jgi:hypothetical protein
LISTLLFFSSCEEIAPVVTGATEDGGNTGVEDQKRQVLIEEFTGIRCVNCPAGSAFIEDLLAKHGQQLIAVSIHAGEFAPPYQQSQYDFRTQEGEQILNYLGAPFGYPTAVVNRRKFDGQFDLQLGQGEWAGYVATEKEIAPKVRIDINPDFNESTRELTVKITVLADKTISDLDIRLSVMIVENNIKDLQLTPASAQPDPNYTHKHVLKGMMTSFDGTPLATPFVSGARSEKTFKKSLPESWVEENCKILAFVSLAGDNKEVLQAHEVDVVE